jgi:phosphoglycerate dehydrogenase-like enzyme
VLITPHVAGSTPVFMDRGWRLVAAQAERYLRGEPLLNVVSDGY